MSNDDSPTVPLIRPREGAPATRLIALDQLRAIAVLLVLWRHAPDGVLAGDQGWQAVGILLQRGGWVGVDVFFVLSGFLVSGILFREYMRTGTVRMGHFLIRRGFKIYPPFYFLIAITVVRALWLTGSVEPRRLLAELFFVQNMFDGLWTHTWSLAVEEHFYLLLALLVAVLLRRGTDDPFGGLPRLCVWMLVGIFLARCGVGLLHSFTYRSHFFPTGLRIDGMMLGVLLSYVYHFHGDAFGRWVRRGRGWWIPLGVVALVPPFLLELEETPWIYTAGFTLNACGAGALLVGMLARQREPGRVGRWLARLGAYSYSIYLWHVPVAAWLVADAHLDERVMILPPWQWMVLYIATSLGVGIALAKVIEVPVLALRDRWFPSRSGALRRAV